MRVVSVWLPEPNSKDDTYARRGEHYLDWLGRSTIGRARECRRFLNENISKLPEEAIATFQRGLRTKWHSTFFELILARLLQELGSDVMIEQDSGNGKHPDFTAEFPDGTVIVEAVAPIINSEVEDEARQRLPLLDIVERNIPKGWHVGVWELPSIGFSDSKIEFKTAVKEMLNFSGKADQQGVFDLVREISTGTIHLHILPAHKDLHKLAWEPPLTALDNTGSRILNAVKRKRSQISNQPVPVLLAVHASGISSDFEDFDTALFGREFERANWQHEVVETGFDADGAFSYNLATRETSPAYAGVLAFLEVGFAGITTPVLYRHPRFQGAFPQPFDMIEQRTYDRNLGIVTKRPAHLETILEKLNFVASAS